MQTTVTAWATRAATAAALALTVAACSSGKSPTAGRSSSPPGSASSGAQQRSGPAYAQCMRQHGVTNFPDPQGPNQNQFMITGAVRNNPNFQSASTACQALRPQQSTSGGGGQPQQLLAFAQCMRVNGVPQFPDPSPNGAIQIGGGVDPNSPQFKHAAQVCSAKTGLHIGGQ